MNFKKIINFLNDIQNIPKYKLEIYKLKNNNQKLYNQIDKLKNEILKLNEDFIQYKKQKELDIIQYKDQIKKLKQKKKTVKDIIYEQLDKKYKRVLLEYQKRWVLDKKNKSIKLLANDFIKPNSWLEYKFNNKTLKDIWTFKIKYTQDDYAYNGAIDVWQLPIETYTLKAGDCDDSTAFRVATAKSVGLEKDYILFMAVGFYILNGKYYGHAFPVKIDIAGRWWILEATSNQYNPLRYPNEYYQIHYLWDENNTWKIHNVSFGGKVLKEFNMKDKNVKNNK